MNKCITYLGVYKNSHDMSVINVCKYFFFFLFLGKRSVPVVGLRANLAFQVMDRIIF